MDENINMNQFREISNGENYVEYIERLLEGIDLD